MMNNYYLKFRAVATGPVSPVSTGPLFPSPMACLASPNRANARQTPMARTQRGDVLQHNTRWLRTVRKTESSNNFPFFQPNDLRRVWLVRLANDRKAETMQCYMAQRAERVDVHACKSLSSGLREASFWPKNGLRSNLIASKFQKIFRRIELCVKLHKKPRVTHGMVLRETYLELLMGSFYVSTATTYSWCGFT